MDINEQYNNVLSFLTLTKNDQQNGNGTTLVVLIQYELQDLNRAPFVFCGRWKFEFVQSVSRQVTNPWRRNRPSDFCKKKNS